MNPSTLKSLQTRIREATGPDRELDARIYGFATNKIPRDPFWRASFGIGRWEFDCIDERGIRASVDNECVPNFTTDPDGLGACVALMREVLPGCERERTKHGCFRIGSASGSALPSIMPAPKLANDCLTFLDAIFSARIAELEAEQEKQTEFRAALSHSDTQGE